jgi:N-acetylneuraminic acid mutarotase
MKRALLQIAYSGAFLLHACTVTLLAQQWDTLAPIPENFTFPVVAVVDGKIHIMGGGGAGGATDAHYRYDPATDTWDSRDPVPYLAQQPAGAAVNGKIHYFGGGFPNSGSPLDDHFMYDPGTDSWTEVAPLTSKRAIHYGAGLDSVLYTMAGQGKANVFQSWTESTNAWENLPNLPDNGFWYGAHVVTNHQIYRFCGGGYTAPNKLTHRFVPGGGEWMAIAPFPEPRHGITGMRYMYIMSSQILIPRRPHSLSAERTTMSYP